MIDEHVYPWCGDLNDTPYIQLGMTLRDHFAGLAMQALLANPGRASFLLEIGERAYEYADAMLKAR